MDYGWDLLGWVMGTLTLSVLVGGLAEALTEAYRRAEPLKWLRFLVEMVPFLRKWSECGFCFSKAMAVGVCVVGFLFFPKGVLSLACAAVLGWRVSHWWHDLLRKLELTNDMLKAE